MSDITQRLANSPAVKIAENFNAQEQRFNELFNPTRGVIDSIRKQEETIGK